MSVDGDGADGCGDVFAGLSPSLSLNSWRADAVARGRRLRFLMDVAVASGPKESSEREQASATLNCYLRAVRSAVANEKPVRRVRSAIFGVRIDAAEINLNAAEVLVARYMDDAEVWAHIPRLLSQVEKCFHPGDPRRTLAIRGLAPPPEPLPTLRAEQRGLYLQTLRSVNDIAQQQLIRVRSFRNKVGLWTIILLVIAVSLAVLGAISPKSIEVCFNPTPPPPAPNPPVACPAGVGKPTSGDVAVVMVLGVLGAALSVAIGLRSTHQTSAPYGVAGPLLMMKLPCGALTALAGLLLIRGGFVPGFSAIDTQEQIIAYAVLFGFAQQLITRFADVKGREVLDKVQKSEPPTPEAAEAKTIDLRDNVSARR